MMFGRDYLGGARYGKVILRTHPAGFAAGFFSNCDGFGDSLPVAKALANTGKCPRFRFQLMWKDGHGYTRKDFRYIVGEAKRVEKLAKEFPEIEFRVSGACEHKFNVRDAREMAKRVKAAAPSCKYVNTPMGGFAFLPEEINEFHGSNDSSHPSVRVPMFDFSFDGISCINKDVTAYKRGFESAQTFYFWSSRDNGIWGGNGDAIPPRKDRTGWPTERFSKSEAYLSNERGSVNLPRNWIWKSHAENHGNGDKRAEHPVLLAKGQRSRVELLTLDGRLVMRASRYPDPPNVERSRYYFPVYGYEIANKARAMQGHATVQVRYGGKIVGKIEPGFRFPGHD